MHPQTILIVMIITVGSIVGLPTNVPKENAEIKNGKAEAPNNPLSGLQQWLSGSSGGGSMVLGTYQALIMPMPQGQDVTNGITNLAQGIQGLLPG